MTIHVSATELARCEPSLRIVIENGGWDNQVAAKVRSMVGERLSAVVMATAALQKKARAKLGDGIWWCTVRSLSQATPSQVADMKARWTGDNTVFDLCCGIGADAIGIANSTSDSERLITAIDRDHAMVAMATENLRLHRANAGSSISIVCDDVAQLPIPQTATVHIDPDRRDDYGRNVRPQDYSPSWDIVQRILEHCDAGIVKLAPAAEIEDQPERHRIWISLSGSVREQTLLTGQSIQRASDDLGINLADTQRSAIVIDSAGKASPFSSQWSDASIQRVEQPDQYIIDPDAAIRASGLTEAFAERYQLQTIGGPAGFLTGQVPVAGDLAICERVIWSGACDDRKLRKTLRSMNCFPWRVKTRGVSQNPNLLEKRYRDCGQQPVTLWIGKGNRRQYAALSES